MTVRILNAKDVNQITATFLPPFLLRLSAIVFGRLSASQIPHRTTIATENHVALFMPARIPDIGTAIKVVSVPTSESDTGGLPASTLVLDESTGSVKALINARSLTALRTAAGSLLSTYIVGPTQPKSLVAFGAGAQINAHISLHFVSYPSITSCTIFNRTTTNSRLSELLSTLRRRFGHVSFSTLPFPNTDGNEHESDARSAISSADLIITATPSNTPLFPSSWVSKGTHIILVGSYKPSMHEVEGDLIRRATRIVVDSREACLAEAGELISAGFGQDNLVSLGELCNVCESVLDLDHLSEVDLEIDEDKAKQLKEAGDLTVFKSVGVGAQDVGIAVTVVNAAETLGVGTLVYDWE